MCLLKIVALILLLKSAVQSTEVNSRSIFTPNFLKLVHMTNIKYFNTLLFFQAEVKLFKSPSLTFVERTG